MTVQRMVQAAVNDMKNGKATAHCGSPATDGFDDMQWAPEYAEPGYTQPTKGVLFANWNGYPDRLTDILERAGYAIEWSDEWSTCGDCGKAVRTSADSYSWTPAYAILNECELVCAECLDKTDYVNDVLLNDRAKADTFDIDLAAMGFTKYNGTYENGFHPGQNDDPRDIVKHLPAGLDFVFQIADVGQFDTRFTLWTRPVEQE